MSRANLPSLLAQFGVVLATLAALASGVAWLVAGRMLRPLRQITDAARRITSEDLHERLAMGGPAEIGLRRALGAARGHIRTQFLAEAILLALAGGAAGGSSPTVSPRTASASTPRARSGSHCARTGPDRRTLFIMTVEWREADGHVANLDRLANGPRTGEILTLHVPVPGAGRP